MLCASCACLLLGLTFDKACGSGSRGAATARRSLPWTARSLPGSLPCKDFPGAHGWRDGGGKYDFAKKKSKVVGLSRSCHPMLRRRLIGIGMGIEAAVIWNSHSRLKRARYRGGDKACHRNLSNGVTKGYYYRMGGEG
ncbi:hypothetical protein BO71DRAFT_222852 [Aspergillus ellipticus CBS 707.79]|uniref:Secreted protein n=1 Tax=Aspergillus ellipticus CBS 707.79 TaxID=1448320 RepID=A0A319DSE5_9EURO|nr:hypothetical protein BO71DRAFT_222852 [Aspergillus ellipticus CBS 707.79]